MVISCSEKASTMAVIDAASNRAKVRPLGIPVITDRCHQGRVRNALEPEWEAQFTPRSYGFRPGRRRQDAAKAIYMTCKKPNGQAGVGAGCGPAGPGLPRARMYHDGPVIALMARVAS
jgi:hypothetical protein